jgi:hypothetical protein
MKMKVEIGTTASHVSQKYSVSVSRPWGADAPLMTFYCDKYKVNDRGTLELMNRKGDIIGYIYECIVEEEWDRD